MIILDTNVVSELMRPRPEAKVLGWLAAQRRTSLFTTSITKAEVFFGIELMSAGRRKDDLRLAARRVFDGDFRDRVLPFDAAAGERYGVIVVARRRAGKPLETLDAQIAAIALVVDAAVATRNTADFENCGVTIVNPWADIS